MTPATLAPRRPPRLDDETTTILPRSRPTKHRTQALDAIDDFDDDERGPLSQRTKLALLIGAVAAVVVIGLLIGYAVRSADNQSPPTPSLSQPAGNETSGGGNPPAQTAVLSDASMLSPEQVKALGPDRTWKVVTTQQGATEESPTAACFGGELLAGHQTPQQEIIRVLESGKRAPLALHAATAYNSPEEASQAYAIASKTLGGCAVPGFYIESGHYVSGVGDQALGVVVIEVNGKNKQAHSVVLSRTGRVVNVLDAARPSRPIAIDSVAKVMSQVNGVICGPAGGRCDGNVSVKDGPPPAGGDEPSFLTSGDLPPAGPKEYLWVANSVLTPDADFTGSQCERVNWATVPAQSRSQRVYLLQESGKDFFGVDEIVLTMKDAKAANKKVEEIKSSFSRCESRMPTANVAKPKKVTSVGAKKTKIAGWTVEVSQRSTKGTANYRVGIVSAGPKVIYTFSNPRGDYNFTDHQWDTIAVRAGERSTLV